MTNPLKFAFFGTSEFSVHVLDGLIKESMPPDLIVTTHGKPQGRGLKIEPSPVKIWADKHNIPSIEPENVKGKEFEKTLAEKSPTGAWDLFVVASYGKIIPDNILYAPKHRTLNVHPSLLPLLRGPAPIETSILEDMRDTGVTIMLLDKDIDHGPIVAQKETSIEPWPTDRITLEKKLGIIGGELLADTIPKWVSGQIKEVEQNHAIATFTKKVEKTDGLIDTTLNPYKNLLKVKAYASWPKAYFFEENDGKRIRIAITDAKIGADGSLELLKVIPEGKKEMSWQDYLRGKK